MTSPAGQDQDRDSEQACLLLREYSFDLGGYCPEQLIALWQYHLQTEASWVRAAVIEALYQGRYKAISVEQILRVWQRRGQPLRHYNHEFERVVFGPLGAKANRHAHLPPRHAPASASDSAPASMSADADQEADSPAAEAVTASPEPGVPTDVAQIPVSFKGDRATAADNAPPIDPFSHPAPIQKFQPQLPSSEFYYRLQAVARAPMA